MAFHPKPEQPEFASLKGTLAQVKSKDNALYQTIRLLIERLTQFQGITVDQLGDVDNSINDINSIVNIVADKLRTYITVTDETIHLPNSRRLVAGQGILLDILTAGQIIISSSGFCYVPMVTGAEPLEIMSTGAGDLLLIAYTP